MRQQLLLCVLLPLCHSVAVGAAEPAKVWALVDETRAVIYCEVAKERVNYSQCPLGPAVISKVIRNPDGLTSFQEHEGLLEFSLPEGLETAALDGCGMVVESKKTIDAPTQITSQILITQILKTDQNLIKNDEYFYKIKKPEFINAFEIDRGTSFDDEKIFFHASNISTRLNECSDGDGCPYYQLMGFLERKAESSRRARVIVGGFDDILTDAGRTSEHQGFAMIGGNISIVFSVGNSMRQRTYVYITNTMNIFLDGHSRCY